MSRLRRIALGLAALWTAAALHADPLEFKQELSAVDSRAGDRFGAAVAVGGNVIAIGAYLADANGKDSGAVYLFRKTESGAWVAFGSGRLAGAAGEWFGFDVAIDRDGKWLIVGAPSPGKGPGSVYLYSLEGGSAVPKDRFSASQFPSAEIGSSVAIDGVQVAAGARGADQRAGRVFLLSLSNDKLTSPQVLAAPQPRAGAELGQSVSLRDGTLAAGAPLPGADGKSPGAAYVSTPDNPSLRPLAVPNGLEAGAAFGYAVAVLKDGAVAVGAPLANGQAGAVYLSGPTVPGAGRDQLGVAVAADGERLLVGARGRDRSSGAAYLLNSSGALVQPPLTPVPPQKPGDELGFSLAIRGDVAVVGSFGKGVAYVFEPPPQESKVTVKLVAPAEVAEGAGSVAVKAVVTVTGSPLASNLVVQVATSTTGSDQALAGSDYIATSKALTFDGSILGTAQEQSVSIPILDDAVPEPDETFTVTLTAPGLTVEGSPASIRVVDCLALTLPGSLSLVEGGPAARFNVSLPRQPGADVTLHFEVAGDASVTLQPGDATFTTAHWERTRTVKVAATDDALCNPTPRSFALQVTAESTDPLFSCIVQTIPGTVANDADPCIAAEVSVSVCSDSEDTVLFEVVVENKGGVRLENLPGPELLATLPGELTVVTASANRGAATVDHVRNEVAWNGAIPVSSAAIIRILASLEPGVEAGQKVTFSVTHRYDEEPIEKELTVGEVEACPPPPPGPAPAAAAAPTRAPSGAHGSWRARPWP